MKNNLVENVKSSDGVSGCLEMNYFYVTYTLNTKGTQVTEMGMGTKLTHFSKHCKGPLLLWHKKVFIPS
jgi:hypothetical protein